MLKIWIIFLLEISINYILRPFVSDIETIQIVVVAINIFFVMIWLAQQKKNIRLILMLAFIARISMMLFDLFTQTLTKMNGDISEYLLHGKFAEFSFSANTYGGVYSDILGVLFKFTGYSQLMAQYLNVLLGIMAVYIVYLCTEKIELQSNVQSGVVMLFAIFPYSIYNSCVTYRETFIATLCTASCFFALLWYLKCKMRYMFLCISCILFASMFHAGVIVLGIGYVILFSFYSPVHKKFVFRKNTLTILFVACTCLVGMTVAYPELFLGKFLGAIEDKEVIMNQFNISFGGSAYLEWLQAQTSLQAILFSPIKMFYLMLSPLPSGWRGLKDIVPFCLDSSAYAYLLFNIFKNRKKSEYTCFITAMLIGILFFILAFGIGTWTAGAAIRHRNKIFAVILMLYAMSCKKRVKSYIKGEIKSSKY